MTIEFSDVLKMHDEAYLGSQNIREKAADDLLFARVTQWDDPYLDTKLEYRGQFDQIRKARRQNLSEMRANPVQVSYIAGRDANDETADILERKYRFDMSTPAAKQAAVLAQQDQLDCGVGGWRLTTDYEYSVTNEQYIKREPIHEANNRVFRDPNCDMPDGSDARYVSVLWTVTALGWPEFAKSIGVSEDLPSTFRPPEDSSVFPWTYENKDITISEFYYRERLTKKAYVFENLEGEEKIIREEDIDDVLDELVEADYSYTSEQEYETFEVRKYWVSGGGILNGKDGQRIPGTEIPIILVYGEVSKVEDQWVWEGIVRLAKDPQRLRNFMMSYLADIAAKGARQRPFFTMSQIEGQEWQFDEGGPDNNRAFYALNDVDEDGNPLPSGPVAYEQPPEMPNAVAGLLDATTGAIDDVTSPGIPQDVASSELSGKAVTALNNRVDMQTYTYLDNFALALQREAEIYATMVPEIYDTPRDIGLLSEDGTEETQTVNKYVFDTDEMRMVRSFDMTKGEYRVRTKVTPAYSSRRDQLRAQRIELFTAAQGNPEAQDVILMEIMMSTDGGDSEVSKKYARQNLLSRGLLEPESDDDKEFLEAQQNAEPEPDAAMVLAQAEQGKAEADLQKSKVDAYNAETNKFKAETDRMEAMIKAKETGANVDIKTGMAALEAEGKQLENLTAAQELQTRSVTLDLSTGAVTEGA